MELKVVIDCGTTNTKLHIVKHSICIDSGYISMGVKDLVSKEQRQVLKQAIFHKLQNQLNKLKRKFEDIEYFIGFGMLTSELGLFDIPHLTAPVSMEEIKSNIKVIYDDIFPSIPIYLISGIKNNISYDNPLEQSLLFADFMRGEETQIAGLIDLYQPPPCFNVFILSSHTKIIHINEGDQIHSSYTTICGQLYQAIKENTSIGKSLKADSKPAVFAENEMINFAEKVSREYGFLRGVMLPRLFDVFTDSSTKDRELFLNALMAFEDLKILKLAAQNGVNLNTPYFVVGYEAHVNIFEKILRRSLNTPQLAIYKITTDEEKAALNVAGAIWLTHNQGEKNDI